MTDAIITSMLNDDLYKFTQGAVVFHNFPNVKVRYEFINRGKTQFPKGFDYELKRQIHKLSFLIVQPNEVDFLNDQSFMRRTYVDWFRNYQYDPSEVTITQTNGDLSIIIEGYWYRAIYWEVKLMAIISELYFKITGVKMDDNWINRILEKAEALSSAGCLWSDFGTRRRFSGFVQDTVVKLMATYKGFVGTSNMYYAMLNRVKPIGTSAHEAVMAMSGIFGPENANTEWLKHWRGYYGNELNIALPDTFTTEVFLRTFSYQDALDWEGLRQDSGDPNDWVDNKIIPYYKMLGVSLKKKKIVFSDNLNIPKVLDLQKKYKDICIPVFGIGTNLTNNVFSENQEKEGIKPLNMVIKLVAIDFGSGWVNVIKLSDDLGKYTGNPETIAWVKDRLGI